MPGVYLLIAHLMIPAVEQAVPGTAGKALVKSAIKAAQGANLQADLHMPNAHVHV